ncbi:MAG: ABC transporter ATP-binding protein [Clostridiales bacterium]|nr:ABC transporter ATP-binding protein [Clostridiales bacterium]
MSTRERFLDSPGSISTEKLFWQPDPNRPPVLDSVDVSLKSGHFYGIIGPNGSGKTSLIRHLLRLIRAEKGRVTINGTDISEFRRREIARLISYVPQKVETGIAFSVGENVMMGRNPHLKWFGFPEKEDRDAVFSAMRATGVEDLIDSQMSILSGGETQRVLVARSVAQECPWLFLDEPVSNLDIYHQFAVMDLLRDLNRKEGKTIVCVLHDINLAAMYCDRIVMMNNGGIVADGAASDVLRPELLERVYNVAFRWVEPPGESLRLFVPIPKPDRSAP